MERKLSKSNIFVLALGALFLVASICLAIFASQTTMGLKMKINVSPLINCKIEVAVSDGLTVGSSVAGLPYYTIFNNAQTEVLGTGITRSVNGGIYTFSGGVFDDFTTNKVMYFKVTNYTNSDGNSLSAIASTSTDNAELTCYPSYGVQNIANESNKIFGVSTDVNFTNTELQINLDLTLQATLTEYTITNSLTERVINYNPQTKAPAGLVYETYLEADDSDKVVNITSINDGSNLTRGTDYTFDYQTGKLTILASKIDAGFTIEATTKPKEITITYTNAAFDFIIYSPLKTSPISHNGTFKVSTTKDFKFFLNNGSAFVTPTTVTYNGSALTQVNGQYTIPAHLLTANGTLVVAQ